MASKRSSKNKRPPAGARTRTGGFPCPDCDFVAKHAMGLGRHRSTRHGAVSKRAQRRGSTGTWITREQAAARAGVHYNTIRQWEQSGLLRRSKRPGVRGALVSAVDLTRVLADRGSSAPAGAGSVDSAAVAALQQKFDQLVAGLDALLATLREDPPRRAKRSAASSGGAKKKAKAKSPRKKTGSGRAKTKRSASKRAASRKRSR